MSPNDYAHVLLRKAGQDAFVVHGAATRMVPVSVC